MTVPLLIVPGWMNSGPQHWQSLWEAARPGARRAVMPDWLRPEREGWVAALDAAVAACPEPPVLACHSLGCIALAHWAQAHARPLRGALLVAPSDVERPEAPPELKGFAPIPRTRLPFPSRVVVAADDPYLDPARAEAFARAWGSAFTQVARGGHLNADAGFGPWPDGEQMLEELMH
jgi:hypothetical protein